MEWVHLDERSPIYVSEVAKLIVASTHVCSLVVLLVLRSWHGILYAFGSCVVLEAALLWCFFSRDDTPRRIMLQTLGLALAGILLVIRTLVDHLRESGRLGGRGSRLPTARRSRREEAAGVHGAVRGSDTSSPGWDDGGARKEEGVRIIGAERWLVAWSVSSWGAFLYSAPCAFALLRQGVSAAMSTFACYVLCLSLVTQAWLLTGTLHEDCSSESGSEPASHLGAVAGACTADAAAMHPAAGTGRGEAGRGDARGIREQQEGSVAALQHLAVGLGGAGHYFGPAFWVFAVLPTLIGAALLQRPVATYSSRPLPFLVRCRHPHAFLHGQMRANMYWRMQDLWTHPN